jgi:hypothetical protein
LAQPPVRIPKNRAFVFGLAHANIKGKMPVALTPLQQPASLIASGIMRL